jgi:cell division protease FtsH
MGSPYGPDGFGRAPYAEATQQVIDEEVARLLRAAEERATELLRTHREQFDRVVDALLAHETIDGSDLLALMGTDGPDVGGSSAREVAPAGGHRDDKAPSV